MPPRWRFRFRLHEAIHGGGWRSRLPVVQKAAGSACAKRFAAGAAAASFPLLKKEEKMKKKKQKKTDAAGKYTLPAAGPGISSGPYGGAQQLPALQTIPFQPLQIQQEPMRPLPLAPGCERGASRGTKERTPADPAGICGATFERSENGVASTLPPAGATTGQPGFAAGEMRPNGSKGRGESGSRVWEKRKAPAFAGPITSLRRPTFLALRK